ncbi:hypothetical protein GCM10010197_38600 [Nocardioides luteus]|uniref:Uncharacterized protein n=1 Tax=Nocardioides luteus TaxID=1844 RepID=A0ABQ5SU82_9ACTN|nr:hypothetical protein GCM10010197_38600 [Nocardioides luteus]GLJ66541.1 hypothetical protein GCM10017579_05770 [Nocardioides luteus]
MDCDDQSSLDCLSSYQKSHCCPSGWIRDPSTLTPTGVATRAPGGDAPTIDNNFWPDCVGSFHVLFWTGVAQIPLPVQPSFGHGPAMV